MTNSQRFGGRLLHFWPLSTMNWPEACTARRHAAQGKCTCMERNTQVYTHTHTQVHTHTCMHVHTHTHTQAGTHTPPYAQQRQAIRLHYRKGAAEAEKQAGASALSGFCMLNRLLVETATGTGSKRFKFSTTSPYFIFLDSPSENKHNHTKKAPSGVGRL